MKKTLTVFLLFIAASAVYGSAAEQGFFSDRFVIRFDDDSDYYTPGNQGGIWLFGSAELDEKCRSLKVDKITKFVDFNANPDVWTEIDLEKVFIVYIPVESDLQTALDAFNSCRRVMYAEPCYIRKVSFTPNDSYFGQQWGLNSTHTQAELAWNYAQGNPAVKIAIVDSGMDMDHPDLIENLWVNPGEDLNGNGIIEQSEINGVDDDSNGHIDDFNGWDFMYNDNNPNDDWPAPEGGHGTHCAGIAAAQTNNGIGVASLSFNCSVIPVRTGEGMYIYQGNQGVAYALNVQADVISLSWGGGGFSMLEQDMYNQAFNNGSFVVAAAGNDNTSEPMYPAGYNNVFAVASTGQNDVKSGFSNYGDWVDISAPGSSIYSTYLNAGYTNMSGTSMACPFTASLAGLIKGAFPNLTTAEMKEMIQSTADNIDALNPNYAGMLGAGRINAYRALGFLYTPNLTMGDYTIDDDGNNNGSPEPGEHCQIFVELTNQQNYLAATGIQAYLTCSEPGITITNNFTTYPDISGGMTSVSNGSPLAFTVENDYEPGYATFYFNILCQPNNYTLADSITILIGTPKILLVDDDGGQTNFEFYYLGTMEAINRNYEYWNNYTNYLMPDQINQYEMVIWFTGNAQTYTLDSYEQYLLMQYLDQGGKLFLTGQYIGDEIANSSFYHNYLHSTLINGDVNNASLTGAEGNSISAGTSLLIVGPNGAGNGMDSPSSIQPDTEAQVLYTYDNGDPGGICYEGNYKVVYFEFAFEAISGMGAPPTTSRMTLMGNIVNWLEASSEVTSQLPGIPKEFSLKQNFPNPFNPSTEISFTLNTSSNIRLSVYDMLGREIVILAYGDYQAGEYRFSFSGEDLSSGIYFAQLKTKDSAKRIKMLMIK